MMFPRNEKTFNTRKAIFYVKTGLERGRLVRREQRKEFFRQASRQSASQRFGKNNENILYLSRLGILLRSVLPVRRDACLVKPF